MMKTITAGIITGIIIGAVSASLVNIALSHSRAEQIPDVIKAKQFQLIGYDGQVTARLIQDRWGTTLTMFDMKEEERLRLRVMKSGTASVRLTGNENECLTKTSVSQDGVAYMHVRTGVAEAGMMSSHSRNDSSSLSLRKDNKTKFIEYSNY